MASVHGLLKANSLYNSKRVMSNVASLLESILGHLIVNIFASDLFPLFKNKDTYSQTPMTLSHIYDVTIC